MPPANLLASERYARDRRQDALGREGPHRPRAGEHYDALGRVADPAGEPDREAVRAERRRGGLDLLDAAIPQPAAVIDHLVVDQLADTALDAERMAPRRQPPVLERAEDDLRVRLEDRRVLERSLRDVPLIGVGIGSEHAEHR